MAQKFVQWVIGSLLTDEELRVRFLRDPDGTLGELAERGWELTAGEVAALIETDPRLWSAFAAKLPSRLQRCSLRGCDAGGPDRVL